MKERTGVITFKGNPMTLVGEGEVSVGKPGPDFTATKIDMSPVRLSDYKGKVVAIVSVPSVDTPVCDTEVRRFNTEAQKLGDDVVVLAVSMDLPFAQRRWCGAAEIKNVVTASDYKEREFGNKYGLRIKELGLLARTVIVVDKQGVVRHVEIVKEVTSEPNYDAALNAVRAAK